MTQVRKFWPILTATYRYAKTLSTRNRGHGVIINAPILPYLIETTQGGILYDVGCDYRMLADPAQRERYYGGFAFGAPTMSEAQGLPARLAALGLSSRDVDVVFLGHLHFDHAGGLHDFAHADVHVHARELVAAHEPADIAYFAEGGPILLCGDAADLVENLADEIAPGLCWRDDATMAVASIRLLKRRAAEAGAELWPNHDMTFFRRKDRFPRWHG